MADLMAKEVEDKTIRTKVGDFLVRTRQYDRALEVYKVGAEKYADEKTSYRLKWRRCFWRKASRRTHWPLWKRLWRKIQEQDALSMRASLQLQYGGKEQQQGAVSDLQALIGRDPKNVVVRYNLARAYILAGRTRCRASAIRRGHQALRTNFLAAYLGSGQVALSQRDSAERFRTPRPY